MSVEERVEAFFLLLQTEGLLTGKLICRGKVFTFSSKTGQLRVERIDVTPEGGDDPKKIETVSRKRKSQSLGPVDKETENLRKKIQSSFKPGKVFGTRYIIISKIGQGGMGTVFKAKDIASDEIVALKMVKPELLKDADNLYRFIREMEIIREINHKNVINILHFGDVEGIQFMAMPFIEGMSLQDLILSSGVLSFSDFLKIAVQICQAIQAIHDRDIVHRDLKPQNIMIDNNGVVYIMDFGLARSLLRPKITTTGQIVGTPEFMSPEQIQDQSTDLKTDIWSLGVMFYEMLTAELPFKGKTLQTLISSILRKNPELPTRINPLIPKILEELILKCLNKDMDKRYNRVSEIEAELQKISRRMRGLESGDRLFILPDTRKRKVSGSRKEVIQERNADRKKQKRRHPNIRVAGFILLIVSMGVLVHIFLQSKNTVSREEKNSWEDARQSDSLNTYRKYLQEFPEGKYIEEARLRISQLKQVEYQKFLDRYEKSLLKGDLEGALEMINRARDFGETANINLLEKRVRELIKERNKKQGEFDRLFELALSSFRDKNYGSALDYVSRSKQIQSTPELEELEKMVLSAKQEEKESQNREYEKYLKLAKKNLFHNRFGRALDNLRMARNLKNTEELDSLENDIVRKKREYLRNKTIKTMELIHLPIKLVRGYYDRLKRIEIRCGFPVAAVGGRVLIRFGVDETGQVFLQEFNESQLTTKPQQKTESIVALVKNGIESIILDPPKNKSGQPVRISSWSLKYNVKKIKDKIVLNIYL